MGSENRTANNPVQSARTTFRVIEGLQELEGAGVTELANHLDHSKTSVYNYLTTLEEEGYVKKTRSEYQLSLKFLDLGTFVKHREAVFEAAKPELEKLAQESDEIINLVVEENGRSVYLHREIGEKAIKHEEYPGYRGHLHNTAAGKAILAQMPRDQVESILDRRGLPSTTKHTITDRAELYDELDRIREQGYALDKGESMEGFRCVAAPVINNRTDQVKGAISVSGPRSRMRGERFKEDLPQLIIDAINVVEINLSL